MTRIVRRPHKKKIEPVRFQPFRQQLIGPLKDNTDMYMQNITYIVVKNYVLFLFIKPVPAIVYNYNNQQPTFDFRLSGCLLPFEILEVFLSNSSVKPGISSINSHCIILIMNCQTCNSFKILLARQVYQKPQC